MSIKTATITFHASHNYGSMLQAYALQQTLYRLGYENEIINLRTQKQKDLYKRLSFKSFFKSPKDFIKGLLFLPYMNQLQQKHALFEKFLSDSLKLTKEYASLEELEKADFNYDCYISGGDQIWNTAPLDFDWSFYLPFVKKGKRISYAVSMGPMGEKAVTDRDKIARLLSNYAHISVREEGTKAVVNGLSNKPVSMELDPALLLSAEEWNKVIVYNYEEKGDYILLYVPYFKKETYEMASFLSKKLGLKVIVTLLGTPKALLYPFQTKLDVGPIEFLSLVKHAKLVVSGSFHALVFATLFHVPFYTVNGDKDNRMKTFLNNLNLLNRTIDINNRENKWKEAFDCDFTRAEEYLGIMRKASLDYLKNAIEK